MLEIKLFCLIVDDPLLFVSVPDSKLGMLPPAGNKLVMSNIPYEPTSQSQL